MLSRNFLVNALLSPLLLVVSQGALFAATSISLSQCGNLASGQPTNCAWQNGNLNANQAHWLEGDSVPYRVVMTGLTSGTSYSLTIGYATTKGGKHAIDYLTSYNRTMAGGSPTVTPTNGSADPCSGVTGCSPTPNTFAIPQDTNVTSAGVTPIAGNMAAFNGTITAVGNYQLSAPYTGDSQTNVTITFTAGAANVVLAWGGHLATQIDWGLGSGVVNISGSPFHTSLVSFSGGSVGSQDRGLTTSAVIFPATITITKVAVPTSSQSFGFTISPQLPTGSTNVSSFSLVNSGSGSNSVTYTVNTSSAFGVAYAFTEASVTGWSGSAACSQDPATGSTPPVSGLTATITPQQASVITCTYTNTHLTTATPTFTPAAGIYPSAQSVTLASTTPGASIRYTTDGSTPTSTSTLYTGAIPVNATTTIKAIALASGYFDSAVASATYTINIPVITSVSPTGGQQGQTLTNVQITGQFTHFAAGTSTVAFSNTLITASSISVTDATHLTATLTINGEATIGAANVTVTTGTESATGTGKFNVNAGTPAATPTFSPVAGTYASSQTVSLSTTTTGASIRYTTDGGTPTATLGTLYSGPITVSVNTTINAIAYRSDLADSAVAASAYVISVAAPTFNPAAGTYGAAQSVAISSTTSGASIRYTIDGSTPTSTTGTLYGAPITVSVNTTVKAVAYKTGMGDSSVSTATYTITVATPTLSPAAGTYTGSQSVTITSATSGASIRYTTDGTTPTSTTGTVYSGPVSVDASMTIKAIAYLNGMADSIVATAAYVINVTAPTFNPAAGTYAAAQSVAITSATSGASIRYTTDGSTPTSTTGTVYTGPVTVGVNTTINAIAYKTGMGDSTVSTAAYAITVASPTFTPAAGTYAAAQNVAITSATSGASIRYTTDGSTPTSTTGTLYSTPVTVSANTTINAIAYRSDMTDSSVATAAYVISVASPTFNPAAGTYAAAQSVAITSATSGASIRYTTDGSTPTSTTGTLYTGPVTVSVNTTINAIAYKTGMGDSTVATAAYVIGVASPTFTPAAGTYAAAQSVAITSTTSGASIRYTTDGSTPTSTTGTLYSGPITVSVNTTINAIAYKTGMGDSTVATAAYAITVASPTFTPAAGTYTSIQTVTINSATSGASIRYTTDGSTPTSTTGTVYSAPLTVDSSMTIKAIAYKTGMADSSVASAAYTLNLPPITVSVDPTSATLYASQTQQFTATVANTANTAVTWSATAGSINASGLYTAPSSIATQQSVTVTATSQADNTKTATATVTLMPPITVSVAPATVSLTAGQTQQFTATVTNAANTAVTWSIPQSAPGSISASGLYTAPSTISTSQNVTVTAKSQADNTTVGTATVNLVQVYSNGYSYRRPIVIDHTKVPNTDQANFPLLISGTYSYLATVANGGKVQNGSGYDIIFTSDCAGAQKLDHEIESYRATDGTVSMWVRIPALSHTTDTVIYMYYGNSAISASQENRAGVWDSNFQTVLHLNESAAPYRDSTVNAYTSSGGTAPTFATGKIGGAQSFDGASQVISFAGAQSPNPTGSITMESWIKTGNPAVKGAWGKWASDGAGDGNQSYEIYIQNGHIFAALNALDTTDVVLDSGFVVSDGNWHHVAVTALASGTVLFYVDGVQTAVLNNTHALLKTTTDRLLVGATSIAAGAYYMQGLLDEVRISKSVRSGDWVATEYANQNSPSTFYTVYGESQIGVIVTPPAATLYATQTQQFTATPIGTCTDTYTWLVTPAGAGNVTAAGLYTAPATITAQQNVTVTATSQLDSSKSASATVTLLPPITISIAPQTGTLSAGDTLQFTATVSNTSNTAVTWTITPAGLGTIDANGLYITPILVSTQQSVTVTATSVANPQQSASAVLTLLPGSFTPIRVNAGGPAYTDPQGLFWSASNGFTGNFGTFGYIPPAGSPSIPVVYQTGLNSGGTFQYQANVPNGQYQVTLKFDDSIWSANSDIFDVFINGTKVINRLNLYSTPGAGQYVPYDLTFPVTVANNQITIVFTSDSWNALINAIQIVAANSVEVVPHNPSLSPQQVMQFSANVLGTTSQAVTWTISPNVGTINSSGLYTAPSSVATPTNVTVTATSVENPNLIGTSIIGLSTSPISSFVPLRVNAGGPDYTDPQGLFWAASNGFTAISGNFGQFSYTPPAGSNLGVLYQTGVNGGGSFKYQASVPNGQYLATLKFDDSIWSANSDVFDVSINGISVIRQMNLYTLVGQNNPYDATFPVNVSNGQITILFTSDSWNALVNAIQIVPAGQIEVHPVSATPWQSQTVQFYATVANTTNSNVTWAISPAGAGSISSTGLYTAPASIPARQTVTVTATGVAAPGLSASATVNLWPPSGVTMAPTTASLTSSQTRQFTATPNNNSTMGVTWAVTPSGFGSISSTGLYTAPINIYTQQTLTVTATSIADGSTGTATIMLLPSPTVTVTPSTVTLGPSGKRQFSAFIAGAWNNNVNWTISPVGSGSITSDGVYTAPASISSTSTVTVTATSAVNSSATGTATITLAPAQPGVSVTVAPATSSLTNGQTQQFSATVTGTGNTAVTWVVTPNVGTITAAGLYTAPSVIATGQTVTIQAVSAAYPTVAGSATAILGPPVTNNYTYRRPIVIDHNKVVNTDAANFVVSVTGTYSYLANVSSGGKVQSLSGYDLIFTSDCAGLQKLDHKIASYNPANGAVTMQVLLSNVSHTADTVFYMSYGNSTVTGSQENRPSVDAALAATHTTDWTATAANNQSSPATFYTIYPENANSLAPSSQTLTSSQTQQFTPLFLVGATNTVANPLTLIGSLPTPSAAESLAVRGNYVYVCDDNEISILDLSNPASPAFVNGVLSSYINNSGNIRCSIQGNKLLAFADGIGSLSGLPVSPAMLSFDLSNPVQPQPLQASAIGARYFHDPVFSADGNTAFMPTSYLQLGCCGDTSIHGASGQLFAVNAVTFNSMPIGALLPNGAGDVTNGVGPQTGIMTNAVMVNPTTLYAVGSNDPQNWGSWNTGNGRLVVADVTDPTHMSVVTQLNLAGTKDLHAIAIQNNIGVAIADNGGLNGGDGPSGFIGNIVIVTFDISNPRNPQVLATIPTTYLTGAPGSKAQIATNQFLFGGMKDASNRNVVLLVDITNPLNPAVTPYFVPAAVVNMTVSGNYLHVSAGKAGYAIYQIPGIVPTQYGLTGACGGPVTWSLTPAGTGTLSASGLYTAPGSITTTQTVTVTATGVTDPSQTASSPVTLTQVLTLSLAPSAPGPYVDGASASFVVTVTTPGGPVSGQTVTFTVTGANPTTRTATTDANGRAALTYTGAARGVDTIQASALIFNSNSLSAAWVNPATLVTTTQIGGQFFPSTTCGSGCEAFNIPSTQVPTFLQNLPDLSFGNTRPFTDTVLDGAGNSAGTIVAAGNNVVAGNGTLAGFSAVFRANFVVKQAGNYTFNLTSADGFLFGIGNGAVRVSGINVNPPASGTTVFSSLPLMAANNAPSAGSTMPIVVTFPAAGSYPYEIDYRSGTGGTLTFSDGIRPLESLVLTASGSASLVTGQSSTYNAQANDETGAPIANLPVTFGVSGVNQQAQTINTDSTGRATFSYAGQTAGVDVVQASATLFGLGLISNQVSVNWITANAPQITVSGDASLQMPNSGHYTATITNQGAGLTVAWTKQSGPGNVTFDQPSQPVVSALFDAAGSYVLRVTATDSLGTNFVDVNVTVQAPVTTEQGWILSPLDGAHITGIVPITLIPGKTLVSGTLTVASSSNLSVATTLNANTTGTGQIGLLDTTLLANGAYWIQLNATDNTGKTMGSGIWVNVIGDYKPGRVTTTVTDLVVPAPGLPIQISRTYDSLVRGVSSDFGYGWSLGIKVQMEIANTGDVTFTINGQRRTFFFTPPGNILLATTPAYTAEPGLFGTLTSPSSNCGTGISNLVVKTGNIWVCAIGYALYQPSTLVYTDPYGRVYTVDGSGNLKSIQDVAGNTLSVTATGICTGALDGSGNCPSTKLNVPFVRDTSGRITQITDPLGNQYNYAYDASGNLQTVTYPSTPATTARYTYDTTHLYTGGTDPRGYPFPTTTYDTSGRLQSVALKPDGTTTYTTSYAYNTTTPVTVTYPDNTTANGFTTTVTYPDSTTSVMVYDAYGKLISSTDALNHTTRNKYDTNHNLISVTDPLGRTTTYGYDASGRRTSVTYPSTPTSTNTTSTTQYNAYGEPTQTVDENSNARSFTYDANFWPKLASDSIGPVVSFTYNANGTMAAKAVGYDLNVTSGKATTYTYDQYGNLQTVTYPTTPATTATYVYDTLGRKTSMTAPGGGTTTYDYDALGNLKTVAAPLGRTTTYTYDQNNNKATETDASSHTTTYEYDQLNRPKKVTYPTPPPNNTKQYTYDFRNNVIDTIDEASRTTHNVYDAAGRLTSVTQAFGTPDAATTSYTYYDDGRKHTETDPLNHTSTYNYDAAGRLTSTVNALSNTTAYGYDNAGNPTKVTDPNNRITTSEYDARRRLQRTIYQDTTTTQYGYDGPGNLTSVTDQAGKVVQYTYDAMNQLQSVIQTPSPSPNPQYATLYGYDPKGNLSTLTDANTHATQNVFDNLSQLKTETMPAGQTQTRNYDAAGNLTSLTDYNGKTTTYTYDVLNRLLSKVPDPSLSEPTVSFTYTATGKRASMTDASGPTNYTYDNLDRLKTKANPQGTLTYTYDAAGNVASMTSSNINGISVSYTYDSMNRLSTVVDNRLPVGQNTTQYSYDPASNLATVTYPNGLQSTFGYDTLNRLTSMNGYQYTLGPTGNRTNATEPSGRTMAWTYDGIYRLTSETITLDPRSNNGAVSYSLDPVGNRLSNTSTIPGISSGMFGFDNNDRLSAETYDSNGNTLATGGKTFAYDFENHLKSMNNSAVTIQYDGDGNRIAKTVGSVTTRYLVDDLNPTGFAQVVEEITATVQRVYTYGLQRISQNQLINGIWSVSFYGYDASGSVRRLTDSTGSLTDSYDYDAWGNTLSAIGSTPNAYMYRGEQYDPDLNLYYLRARYFNARTGRFLTRDFDEIDIDSGATESGADADGELVQSDAELDADDPPRDPSALHLYLYASGDPVNSLDPSGHQTLTEDALLKGFLITGGTVIVLEAAIQYRNCTIMTGTSILDLAGWVDRLRANLLPFGMVRVNCSVYAFAHKGKGKGSKTRTRGKHQKGQARDKQWMNRPHPPDNPPKINGQRWKGYWPPPSSHWPPPPGWNSPRPWWPRL
jgi:RHS repeat-associated protein